ncbi:hypothetical protein L598_000700000960 [Mesorhizobium sp. J18]|uniref:hypothetical protein n=1 Tax=Mesorhizobium sp. J18 TaxID=935263 RepID=UPI00119AE38B|nr:hypothetical protein [Mesorhizobium sp. J18]TWG90339.1 hypothetical protein L598_000700000960 [Mesorhizobium sp. J18]
MSHPCDVYRVARQCGVILRDSHEHSPTSRRPRECFCKPTLREIGREHGEDHLRLVLMLMTGTKANSAELYADMIKAVSAVLLWMPDLLRRPTLVSDFNAIDLGSLRRKARAMNCGVPTTHVLRILLATRFYQPIQGDMLEMLQGEAA